MYDCLKIAGHFIIFLGFFFSLFKVGEYVTQSYGWLFDFMWYDLLRPCYTHVEMSSIHKFKC